MSRENINYWVGIVLLFSVISFFFYKSIFSELPLNQTLTSIEKLQYLQVQLHRDMLRYRSNKIRQYDTLNTTLSGLEKNISELANSSTAEEDIGLGSIQSLENEITRQSVLVEDFKTHHSILQNSLSFIFNLSSDIYSTNATGIPQGQLSTKAELIALLLEYKENPELKIANNIYPLIDELNHEPDIETTNLINHSLMIIERLPEIDRILDQFNSLSIENDIILLKDNVSELRNKQNNNAHTFNILLFLCTIYLFFYLMYIFISLRKSEEKLSHSYNKLNDEIKLRSRTEKALYQLVDIDKNSNNSSDEDRILFLLNALCQALDVEYAFITQVNTSNMSADILGMLDHGMFSSNISYQLSDTPCEEVINNGRLVLGQDFANYFPDCNDKLIDKAVSFIGISLKDKDENVIGMLAVASSKPIEDSSLAENILTLASSRAVIELEHHIELNNSQRYQQGLAKIDDWIARLITEGYDREAFFKNICRAAQEITHSQLSAFPVFNEDNDSYHFLAACGIMSEKLEGMTMSVDDGGLCAWTILNNQNLLINDVKSDPRSQKELSDMFNISSALLTPVTLKDMPYGAIALFRTVDDDEYDEIDEQLISQFSQSIQMAIINMQLVSDMKSERERAEVTLHSIGDAVITTNVNGEVEYMNHVAETLTAWTLDQAKNLPVQNVFRIEDLDTGEPIHDVVKSCLYDSITINKSVLSLVSKHGNRKDIESSISPILNTSGKAEGVVIVFHDETQRRQLEKTIKYQAAHDPLTDLLNRDAFDIRLSDHVYDAINNDKHHVLCYLDLNRFKLINDTAGHDAGDQCLIQVTSLIQSSIRNDDVLSRFSGDEFGLILTNCDRDGALKTANGIIKRISEMAFNWDGCDYKLGVSIGVNLLDKNTHSASDAIRKADLACYTAKDQNKNQVYIYEEEDSELIRRQEESYWASRISEALENDRLKLYAQKIISLKNKDSYNQRVEVLARLIDEDGQIVLPNAFIPAAERYDLMHLIDRKIISKTFSFISKHADKDDSTTYYSINLSGNSLCDNSIIDYIRSAADEFEINTRLICFEITETAAIKNMRQAKHFIKELKAAGFKFALDDFGSGLSSFQYLRNLSVDYLKIEGSFVADMVNNNIDHAMVAAINKVGHIMGIETIAEYVENDQIIKKLQDIKVDFGQGYGIEQPKPIEQIITSSSEDKSPSLKIIHNKP